MRKRWGHFAQLKANGAAKKGPASIPAPSTIVAPSPPPHHQTPCDAASLAAAATKLAPLAAQLVATPFFRHFKVDLRCECPFWPDDGTCSVADCAVCECPSEEVPEALRDDDEPRELASCPAEKGSNSNSDDDAAVDREVEPGTRARLIAAKGWRGVDNPWMDGSVVEGEEAERGEAEPETEDEEEELDNDEDDEDDDEEEDDCEEDEEEEEEDSYSFIDLLKNPERYTGYSGPSARRIWDFVYSQSCFGGRGGGGGGGGGSVVGGGEISSSSSSSSPSSSGVCSAVQQTLYRVMSGVHSSISAHIAADYLLEPAGSKSGDGGEEKEAEWGPNLALFAERLSLPDHAERVDNLRFAYAFVARALLSARPLLLAADYSAGGGGGSEPGGGSRGRKATAATAATSAESELVRKLLTDPALEGVCAAPFDAARHLPLSSSSSRGSSSRGGGTSSSSGGARAERALEKELQAAFRNVTAVMDCVGCEKCKLWGKLQLMGVATALKVLVAERRAGEALAAAAAAAAGGAAAASSSTTTTTTGAATGAPQAAVLEPLVLERNEVVALVNLFERLSRSVVTVGEMQARLDSGEVPTWPSGGGAGKGGRGGGEWGREAGHGDVLAGAVGVF